MSTSDIPTPPPKSGKDMMRLVLELVRPYRGWLIIVFIAMIVEFLMVPKAATSTFFLLMVAEFVDVLGGFTVSVRTAQRDIGIETADRIVSS